MKRILLLTVIALILGGCAQQKQSFWEKPGASGQDFEMDKSQCNAQAFSVPGANWMTVAVIQNQCLRGKGWYLTDTPSTAPNTVQRVTDEVNTIGNQITTLQMKPEYQVVIDKAPIKLTDITFTHLSDKSKMNANQKAAFLAMIEETDVLVFRITSVYRNAGDPKAQRIADLRDAIRVPLNQNRLNLIDQKITWGEFNLKRQEVDVSFKAQFQQIVNGR